jgi:hypothetical protein
MPETSTSNSVKEFHLRIRNQKRRFSSPEGSVQKGNYYRKIQYIPYTGGYCSAVTIQGTCTKYIPSTPTPHKGSVFLSYSPSEEYMYYKIWDK